MISPVKIVKTPCPGIPGTDRIIPATTRNPPNIFFREDKQMRKTGFLIRLIRSLCLEII